MATLPISLALVIKRKELWIVVWWCLRGNDKREDK
jgi:hypothetical protein